ncbi:hypothetical protein ACSBR1_039655 [Camellia fascicularis]
MKSLGLGSQNRETVQEIFYEKYFLQCIRDRKVSKFERLKQGNQTIAEYGAQFTEFPKFALHRVNTDYKKARKFEGGFENSIQERVNILKLPSYVDVLDRALMTETNMAVHNRPSEWTEMKQGPYSNKGSTPSKKPNLGTSSTSNSTRDSTPTYTECRKKHWGVCYRTSGACFKCCKIGQMVRDCSQVEPSGGRPAASSTSSVPIPRNTTRPTATRETLRQGRTFPLVLGDT